MVLTTPLLLSIGLLVLIRHPQLIGCMCYAQSMWSNASVKTTMVLLPIMEDWAQTLVLMKTIYGESTPSKLHAKLDKL